MAEIIASKIYLKDAAGGDLPGDSVVLRACL